MHSLSRLLILRISLPGVVLIFSSTPPGLPRLCCCRLFGVFVRIGFGVVVSITAGRCLLGVSHRRRLLPTASAAAASLDFCPPLAVIPTAVCRTAGLETKRWCRTRRGLRFMIGNCGRSSRRWWGRCSEGRGKGRMPMVGVTVKPAVDGEGW